MQIWPKKVALSFNDNFSSSAKAFNTKRQQDVLTFELFVGLNHKFSWFYRPT